MEIEELSLEHSVYYIFLTAGYCGKVKLSRAVFGYRDRGGGFVLGVEQKKMYMIT